MPLVLVDSDTLQLNPAAAVVVDARRFAALIGRIRPGLGELEEAVALYRGDFLADFYLPDSNPFEEWAAARREAYRRGVLLALERLTAVHLADEDFAAAENYARRQLVVDPLHEAGNRQLIELLARAGRRRAALAHFDDYRRLLNVELGVTPGSETRALVSAVQGGELFPAARRPDHIRGYEIHEELGRGTFGVVFRAAVAAGPAVGEAGAPAPAEPLLSVDNPYKGLLAFGEADAALFYGRETLTQQLVGRLAEVGSSHRFLAVVGPSGSGKSSLVKARLVPALRRGALPGADKWFVLDMVPGAHPFEELETALLRVAVNPPASLLEQLQDGERGLLRAVRRTLPPDAQLPDGASELLLIIDQFEELFTLVADRDVTARFLNGLLAAVSDPRSPLRVIATLRADFYDRPLLYPGLSEVVQQRTEVVIPMTADEAAVLPVARRRTRSRP